MRVASALVCLLQGAAVAAQEGCPEDVRYCTSNNQTQVRDPANDCEFPCCPDFDEDCPQPQVTTTSPLVPQLVDSPAGGGVFCTDDVRQCPSSPGGYQARDPANNCEFPCCPDFDGDCPPCPDDVRYCTSNNQTQVRDPANNCQFPCCPDFDGDCPPEQASQPCPDDVRDCPSSPGGYQARDPANNCEFPCCPEIESCCLGDVKDVEGGEIKASFDPDQSATCTSPTCRRFRGEASESCAGFDLLVTLGSNRTVEIVTCPVNETLTIQLNGDQSPFTPEERSYFSRTAHKIETSTSIDLNNKESLDAQFVHAARILAEWPDGLEVAYELNATAERLRQGTADALPAGDSSVRPNPPNITTRRGRRNLQSPVPVLFNLRSIDPPIYTSLCPHLGDWLLDYRGGNLRARLDMDPPCAAPDSMYAWDMNATIWQCTDMPIPQPQTDWAYGDCFGRCGGGCGSGAFRQYTLDCAAYDFCTRFVIANNSTCHDEFLYAVDDWLWSGNCDEETGEEVPKPEGTCEPTSAPTEEPCIPICHVEFDVFTYSIKFVELCLPEPAANSLHLDKDDGHHECDWVVTDECPCVLSSLVECRPSPSCIIRTPPDVLIPESDQPMIMAAPQFRCRLDNETEIPVNATECDELEDCFDEANNPCEEGYTCVEAPACMADIGVWPSANVCVEDSDCQKVTLTCGTEEDCTCHAISHNQPKPTCDAPDPYCFDLNCDPNEDDANCYCAQCDEGSCDDFEVECIRNCCQLTSGLGAESELGRLNDNRETWEDAGLVDYDFTFRRSCFCTEEYRGPFYVQVRNGTIASLQYVNPDLGEPSLGDVPTIEEMFDSIATAINQSVAELQVDYDANYGFPSKVYIDYISQAVDDEITFSVTDFNPSPTNVCVTHTDCRVVTLTCGTEEDCTCHAISQDQPDPTCDAPDPYCVDLNCSPNLGDLNCFCSPCDDGSCLFGVECLRGVCMLNA